MTRPRLLTVTVALALASTGACRDADELLENVTARVLVVDVERDRTVVLELGGLRRQSHVTTENDSQVEFALALAAGVHEGTIAIVREREGRESELEGCRDLTLTVTDGAVDTVVIDASELEDCDGGEGEEGEGEGGEEGEGEAGEGEGEAGEGEGEAGEGEGEGEEGEGEGDEDPCEEECVEIAPGADATCDETCDFFCGDGCAVSSVGDAIHLDLACGGGSCDAALDSTLDSDARVTCSGATCDVVATNAPQSDVLVLCESGACDLTCNDLDDGSCTLRCNAGTTCTMACTSVSTCHLECEAGATCTVNECADSGFCGPFGF